MTRPYVVLVTGGKAARAAGALVPDVVDAVVDVDRGGGAIARYLPESGVVILHAVTIAHKHSAQVRKWARSGDNRRVVYHVRNVAALTRAAVDALIGARSADGRGYNDRATS